MAMKQRAGFTLVELMIAMVAGAFAVAGVYYLNGMSARSYAQQLAVSDAQMSLRSAMEQIRRDVARAGYLAAPATSILRNCSGAVVGAGAAPGENTSQHFQAITIGSSGSLSYAPDVNTANGTQVTALLGGNPVAADDLTMFGNFATADAYLADPTSSSLSQIVLQQGSESFRRSFFTPSLGNASATADYTGFTSTFAAGRMLRVEHGGRFFFRQIQSSSWAAGNNPVITLASSLPQNCVEPTGWLAVAPVSRIHYGLESDLTPDYARLRASATLPGSRRALLVRREETTSSPPPTGSAIPSAGGGFSAALTTQPQPNGTRVVLDYAVEFGVSALRNNAGAGNRPNFVYAITPSEITTANTNPDTFRSLIVTISSRSAEVDPRLGPVGAARRTRASGFLGDPLLTFNVIDPNFPALTALQARVRTMRAEIFLHNL